MRLTPFLIAGFVLLSLIALTVYPAFLGTAPQAGAPLPPPREHGALHVLTLSGPASFRRARDETSGFEADLTSGFAEYLGLPVEYSVYGSIEDALAALERGEGHLVAAGLTITEARAERVRFGPAYMNVRERVVCRRGGPHPRTPEELIGLDIVVVAGSSYVETLQRLQAEHPDIAWRTRQAGSALPILRDVARGRIDCTVSDSHLAAFARRRFPELITSLALTEERPLAWALRIGEAEFDQRLEGYFADLHESGALQEMDARWFGRFAEFDYVDVARFVRRLDSRLPPFEPAFRAAAAEHGFDWRLLAAQAYQESHWEPDAVSPTGVRGLMMLTLPTAERVGVSDRLDPEQSIRGGADYLDDLYDRVPAEVTGEDRLWFALAAYNVGMGHMYDARRVAERNGLGKNSWDDLAASLPLLSQREVYETLRYGYARGREPVEYVARIREYYAMMRANRPE